MQVRLDCIYQLVSRYKEKMVSRYKEKMFCNTYSINMYLIEYLFLFADGFAFSQEEHGAVRQVCLSNISNN